MTIHVHDRTRKGALSVLREGRLQLIRVIADDTNQVHTVLGRVTGHHGLYVTDYLDGQWTCTCRPWMSGQPTLCAHIHAAQLVTTLEGRIAS